MKPIKFNTLIKILVRIIFFTIYIYFNKLVTILILMFLLDFCVYFDQFKNTFHASSLKQSIDRKYLLALFPKILYLNSKKYIYI